MNHPYIVGWGHTPFGKLDNLDLEQMIREAALPAIENAGLQPSDIDGIFVGHFNAGFVPQDFSAALVSQAIPELRHVPAVRLENACATGSAAIWAAMACASPRPCRRERIQTRSAPTVTPPTPRARVRDTNAT